jgi:hypothetical protein
VKINLVLASLLISSVGLANVQDKWSHLSETLNGLTQYDKTFTEIKTAHFSNLSSTDVETHLVADMEAAGCSVEDDFVTSSSKITLGEFINSDKEGLLATLKYKLTKNKPAEKSRALGELNQFLSFELSGLKGLEVTRQIIQGDCRLRAFTKVYWTFTGDDLKSSITLHWLAD